MHDGAMTTTVTTVPLPPDLALRDRYRREGQRMARVSHPALAPVVSIAIVSEGLAVTTQIPADATPLPAQVSAPEALAALSSVAAGVAHLHDAGYSIGSLRRDALWRRPDGSGLLAGWHPGADPTSDVADLAELLAELLPAGSVGSDVVSIMVSGADPHADARPSMARMAAVLDLAARSNPVGAVGAPPSPPAIRRAAIPSGIADSHVEVNRPGSDPAEGAPSPRRQSRSDPGRGRHAAPGSRRVPLRLIVAASGTAGIAFLGMGAVGGSQEPTVSTCVVDSTSTDVGAPSSPPPPVRSQKQSSGRSK